MKPQVFNYQDYERTISVLRDIDATLNDNCKDIFDVVRSICEIMSTSGIKEYL